MSKLSLSPTVERWFIPATIVATVALYPVMAAVALSQPPHDLLPSGADVRALLTAFLAAQAAIAALTLAVTQFVLQTVAARRDSDHRTYQEYVRRSAVQLIFVVSLFGVAVTGVALLSETLLGVEIPVLSGIPGARNLLVLPILSFFQNLMMPLLLFAGGLRLSRPDEWRKLRRQVDEREVRNAVRAFLARRERLDSGDLGDGEDEFLADFLRDQGEDAADEAVEALLRDATIAMSESRHGDFEWALESMVALVEFAMEELGEDQSEWDAPGSQAKWPPLSKLHQKLRRFRQAVIQRGDTEHAAGVAAFDTRLALVGVERRCGELFTLALDGHRTSYTLASEARNDELRRLFRDAVWSHVRYTFSADDEGELPYLREAARQQAVLLFGAMRGGHVDDFREFSRQFDEMISNIRAVAMMYARDRRRAQHERADEQQVDARLDSSWVDQVREDAQVALMEVGGVAIHLAESGKIPDPQPYLDVVRSEYPDADRLVRYVARAIDIREAEPYFWTDLLDSTVAIDWTQSTPIRPALSFFAMRLLELAHHPMPDLDLGGTASPMLDWFRANAPGIEPYASRESELPAERRRELATNALEAAAQRHEEAQGARF